MRIISVSDHRKFYTDPDLGSKKCPNGSGSKGVNNKKEKLHQKIVNKIFQNDMNKSLKINKQNTILSTVLQKDPYF